MSLVNSPAEPRKPYQFNKDFQYPRDPTGRSETVLQHERGHDRLVIYFQGSEYPDVKLSGTSFEFGAYGKGILKEIKNLRTMIYENQVSQHGSNV